MTGAELVEAHVAAFNHGVRTGDWEPMRAWFADDAELAFDGVPIGPFHGVEEIVRAYEERPPDDLVLTFGVDEGSDTVVARYGWLREPATVAGRMILTASGDRIAKLLVTFDG